jgi:phosphopantetheinyl transferase
MRRNVARGVAPLAGIVGPAADALHTAMLLGATTLEKSLPGGRGAGEAVYCAILRVSAFSSAALARWAHPDDVRAVRGGDRRLARALVRAILCTLTGTSPQRWTFRPDAHGRPVAVDICGRRSPFLSIAHSHGWLACIVSGCHPAGVDIETFHPGRSWQAIAQLAFGPLERAHVLQRGPGVFLRLWTAREALAKATNEGFTLVVDRADYVPAYQLLQGLTPFRYRRTPAQLRSVLAREFCLAGCVIPRASRVPWLTRPGSHKAVAAVVRACGGAPISPWPDP